MYANRYSNINYTYKYMYAVYYIKVSTHKLRNIHALEPNFYSCDMPILVKKSCFSEKILSPYVA